MQPQRERGGKINNNQNSPWILLPKSKGTFLYLSLFPVKLGSFPCFIKSLGIAAGSFRRKTQGCLWSHILPHGDEDRFLKTRPGSTQNHNLGLVIKFIYFYGKQEKVVTKFKKNFPLKIRSKNRIYVISVILHERYFNNTKIERPQSQSKCNFLAWIYLVT